PVSERGIARPLDHRLDAVGRAERLRSAHQLCAQQIGAVHYRFVFLLGDFAAIEVSDVDFGDSAGVATGVPDVAASLLAVGAGSFDAFSPEDSLPSCFEPLPDGLESPPVRCAF